MCPSENNKQFQTQSQAHGNTSHEALSFSLIFNSSVTQPSVTSRRSKFTSKDTLAILRSLIILTPKKELLF